MAVPITTPQVLERLGCFKDELRPFTVVTVPFPKKEVAQLWTGYFIMPYTEKIDDLHGRPMVNVVSGATFYTHDKNSSTLPKLGWLTLKTMEDEINHLLFRAESKFCTPNGGTCTSKTVGLLVRRHIVAGEFHYVGKEASTRWASGPDLSMLAEAGATGPICPCLQKREPWTPRMKPPASTKELLIRNIWIKSGQKQNSFPRSYSLGNPELPSAQYEILRMARIRSSPALCES